MKKILLLLVATTFLCNNVYAKHDCDCHEYCAKMEHKMMKKQGGFIDSTAKPMSIAEIQKLSDDSYVTMSGYITKRLSDDKYNFSDGKNNITVEIDNKIWQGQTVTPKDKVLLTGKIDKDLTSLKVDIKSLAIEKNMMNE